MGSSDKGNLRGPTELIAEFDLIYFYMKISRNLIIKKYEPFRAIKNVFMSDLWTLKHVFEDLDEKPECKQDATIVYNKLEYTILTGVWKEVQK